MNEDHGHKESQDSRRGYVRSHEKSGEKDSYRSDRQASQPICFVCQEKGHKANECPKKKKNGQKYKQIQVRKVMTPSPLNPKILTGKVGSAQCKMLLDTGANVTVVSDRLVKNDQYLDQDIQMTGVNGITMFHPKARVWIHVGSFTISQEVAVVKDLPDEVILGLDLGEAFDELLLKYMLEEKKKVVEVCEYRKVYPNDVIKVEGDLAGLQNEEGKSNCEGKERKIEEVKVTRGQRKSEEEHEKEIEKTENEEGVSVISPGSLKEGSMNC